MSEAEAICYGCDHCGCDPHDPDDACWVCDECPADIDDCPECGNCEGVRHSVWAGRSCSICGWEENPL